MMEIMERAEAKEKGLSHYFTGRPCPRGHVAARFTSKGWCVECAGIQSRSEEKKEYDREYNRKNAERVKRRQAAYYNKNKDRIAQTIEYFAQFLLACGYSEQTVREVLGGDE